MTQQSPPSQGSQAVSLAKSVMRRQASLSLRVAAIFVALLAGLPLFNAWFPEVANRPFAGFTVSWFLLGISFFPITWLLSAYFVKASDRLEAEAAAQFAAIGLPAGAAPAPANEILADLAESEREVTE